MLNIKIKIKKLKDYNFWVMLFKYVNM